jgi:2-methylcitrate dehydratase PrpD
VVDGQFSGPFVVAVALATGQMGWDSYRLLDDPAVRALARKVRCVQDPEIEAEFPANMSGKVTVKTAAGEVSRKVVVPKGEPDNFLTDQELAAKFHGLVDRVMGAERAAALAEAVLGLATARDVAGLMRLASPLPAMRLAGE